MTALAVIGGLGIYKIVIAVSRGRFNILFLLFMLIFGSMFVFLITRTRRISRRGRRYLQMVQDELRPAGGAMGPGHFGSQPDDPGLRDSYAEELAMLVGVFGFSMLAGTAYAEYMNVLGPPASSGDTSGGCGGGGCGGGSGDSSGDGGGCGGGGCGGCGGGD